MAKSKRHCTVFLILMIISVVITLCSIPLFIIGNNKYQDAWNKNPFKIGGDTNTEQILAITLFLTGFIMTIIFGFLYKGC